MFDGALDIAHNTHINDTFINAIDSQDGIDFIIKEGADLAGAHPCTDGGKGQVLCYVTGVYIYISVCALIIFPCRAPEYGSPDEYDLGIGTHILSKCRLLQLESEIS